MRRAFWVALGAAAGVVAARRLTRAAEAMTPAGVGSNLGEGLRELGDAARYFADQVRAGMAEREAELYEALGVLPDGTAAPVPHPDETRPAPTHARYYR